MDIIQDLTADVDKWKSTLTTEGLEKYGVDPDSYPHINKLREIDIMLSVIKGVLKNCSKLEPKAR